MIDTAGEILRKSGQVRKWDKTMDPTYRTTSRTITSINYTHYNSVISPEE